jgi:hypothetical protein
MKKGWMNTAKKSADAPTVLTKKEAKKADARPGKRMFGAKKGS